MTTPTSTDSTPDAGGSDQVPAQFAYGHGRMPFFMKIAWLAFLAFGAWYVVTFVLRALADEVG